MPVAVPRLVDSQHCSRWRGPGLQDVPRGSAAGRPSKFSAGPAWVTEPTTSCPPCPGAGPQPGPAGARPHRAAPRPAGAAYPRGGRRAAGVRHHPPPGQPPTPPPGQVMPDTRDPTCIRPSHTGVGQAGERVRGRLSVSGSWIALPPPQRRSWTVRTSSSGSCWPVKSSCSRQSGCPSCGSCAASLVCT